MNWAHVFAAVPVPKDIPLPLPLPEWLAVGLLIFSFMVHILFVNLMLGGTLLTFFAQLKGLKEKDYDQLAHEIAKTITVNKSLAVVMGVAPLLLINTLYTVYFYSANALTGLFWIAIVPLVTVGFLLTYPHKYLWEILKDNKGLHIAMIGSASAIFLFVPLIFLTNINLMLYPEKWGSVAGFFSALTLPNVLPRYFHFIFASLTVTGLFLFWYFGREKFPHREKFQTLTRYDIQKRMLSLAFMATLLQFVAGPLVLLTLPSKAMSWQLLAILAPAVVVAIVALVWMWQSVSGPAEAIGSRFTRIVVALSSVVILMVSGRHVIRETALGPHKKLMAQRTTEYEKLVAEANAAVQAAPQQKADTGVNPQVAEGEKVFQANCVGCHAVKTKLVGPPVTEMASIYAGKTAQLVQWIKKPGKKRPDYPQMPGFPQLKQSELEALSAYILAQK
jgi:cytochrome c